MKKLLLILLTCLVVPPPLDAGGQTSPWRIAYDFCAPFPGENVNETVCEIQVWDDQPGRRTPPARR